MGVLTNCCLHFPPPPPPLRTSISPPSPNSTTSQVACRPKERSWKTQSVLSLTIVIIGLEMGSLGSVNNQDSAFAAADNVESAVGSNTFKVQRWSDRRACDPWRTNSLETIVPENLPRPSSQRRWEAVGFPPEDAPPIIVLPKYGTKSCYIL
ncbi:protein CHLOROPLAST VESICULATION [Primulina eburnea]|uniref:protein CHLOROPLAST VESICULATION n=1 Tax=Primulina eburnea TaxID=1245227 RepID=UPI003C6C9023